MDKKIPDGVVLTAAYALSKEWNLHYPDAVRMAALVLSVGQQWQPAETSNARSEWPARYMANGPQGTFYTDDLKLADALLRAYDEDDDWTVTEMPDPAGTPAVPQPPSTPVWDGPVDANSNAEYIEHCADVLERRGLRVTAGALRVIAQEHRTLSQQHAAERVDVRKLVALAEQWERYADGCRPYGFIKEAELLEYCAQCIRQTLGISASESSFIMPGRDPLVEKLLSIVIKDKEKERTTARAEQPAAICTCPHQDAREPYHDVACPARPAQQPATSTLVGAEDIEVLKRLRAALPDVGLNGWWLGVEVLNRVIDALDTKHKEPTT